MRALQRERRHQRRSRIAAETQWVENLDAAGQTHYVFGRIEPDDRQRLDARQLHDHADALAPALRAAVRLGRRLRDVQGADRRPRRRATTTATRRTRTPANRTSTTGRSARPTSCAGNTGPGSVLFVVWQQGREGVAPIRRLPVRPRLRRPVRRAGHQRVPGQNQPLVQLLITGAGPHPRAAGRAPRVAGCLRAYWRWCLSPAPGPAPQAARGVFCTGVGPPPTPRAAPQAARGVRFALLRVL